MGKPNLKKLLEIMKDEDTIARYESHLEQKCLYDLEKKSAFSAEIKDYFKRVDRGIKELEKGISENKRIPFQYGTEKYDLSIKGQQEVQSILQNHLAPNLVLLLGGFLDLEDEVQQKTNLTLYCGAASPSGNGYALSNEPIFLIPREDSTVIFINAQRRKNRKGTQWTVDIVGDYCFAELEEKTTIRFTNNYFNYIYYIEGAEEYPLEETIIPIIKKKYDQLFTGE
ncbi:MAG: hypothetical protein Q8R37_01625 [Nanoarchaeota archaeon]|nr:hypothetical protein [Nanoarchaeota archaeon]